MIQASTQYVPHLLILLVLAAVPTLLHQAKLLDADDCANPSQLLVHAADAASAAGVAASDARFYTQFWGEGNWSHGTLPVPGEGARLEYVVVRSFDPKVLYHWPEARVIRGARPDRRTVEIVEDGAFALPVHRAHYDTRDRRGGSVNLVAYLLMYHGRPVANPYRDQLLAAPVELVTGRRPMWLFLVFGEVAHARVSEAEQAAREWLVRARELHRAACAP